MFMLLQNASPVILGNPFSPCYFSPTEPINTPMIHDHIQDSQVESENKRKRSRHAPKAQQAHSPGPSARSLNACQLQVNTCACLNDLILEEQKRERLRRKLSLRHSLFSVCEIKMTLSRGYYFLLRARSTFTAHATEHPTMGLLPIPRKPIISTCAGTDEEPAN